MLTIVFHVAKLPNDNDGGGGGRCLDEIVRDGARQMLAAKTLKASSGARGNRRKV